jgi:hypothetical protein
VNKIVTDLDGWKTTKSWVDAYTATIEASFDAAMNPEIRSEVNEALKAAQAQALATKSEQDINVARQQAHIARRVGGFSAEQYDIIKKIWKVTAEAIIATSWKLTEEIFYAEEPTKEKLRFWQGDSPLKNFILLPRDQSSLFIKFLRFVQSRAERFDPVAHTKQMLESQGINEHNFDEYADKLAITNPWKPIP